MITLDLIVGARPNFMKIGHVIKAIERQNGEIKSLRYRLVHTGQHYDPKITGRFFTELGIPEPHVNLNAGGCAQAELQIELSPI